MELFEQSTRRPVTRVSRRWWEYAGIDLEGAKKRVAAAEAAADSESDSDSGREETSGASGSSGVECSGVEWSGRANAPLWTKVWN